MPNLSYKLPRRSAGSFAALWYLQVFLCLFTRAICKLPIICNSLYVIDYTYIYIYIDREREMYIYIYIYIHTCILVGGGSPAAAAGEAPRHPSDPELGRLPEFRPASAHYIV